MAGEKAQSWFVITPENEGTFDVFRRIPLAATDALYAIDAADFAKAVPHVRIWKLVGDINSRTNTKIGPPLSNQFFAPPTFGQAVSQFSERPAASIESATIKKHNPGGFILFREMDLVMTVHRPDILNNVTHRGNIVNSLLQPGNNFVIEYGWVGGRNPVLGPGLSAEEQKEELNPPELEKVEAYRKRLAALDHRAPARPDPDLGEEPKFFKTIFTAVQEMRFAVTNYSFTIMQDGQIKFNIHCIEDAELEVRSTTVFEQPGLPEPPADLNQASPYLEQITSILGDRLKDYSFTERVIVEKSAGDGKPQPSPETFIELQDVLNVLFAMPIVQAVRGLQYSHVHLYTGVFNEFAPRTNASLGAKEWAGMPIGLFWLRLKDVFDILNKVVTSKGQITVYNLLKQVLALIMSPAIYDVNPFGTSVPELAIYTLFNPKAGYARFQIVDRKRFLTIVRGATGLHEHNLHARYTDIRARLPAFLKANFMPKFSLYHQLSPFKDAKFEVVNDEHMKSIFVNRVVRKSREQIASGAQNETETNAGLPMGLLMYRSAVKGQVTVIGNFGFDLMGLVWVSFGVPLLDGIFYVVGKTDTITKDGFTSALTLQAEGSNPLNAKVYDAQVAEDFVKEKILARQQTEFTKLLLTNAIARNDEAALNAERNASTTFEERQRIIDERLDRQPPPFGSNKP